MTSSLGSASGKWSRRQGRSWSPCMAPGTRGSRIWATAATWVLSCRPSSASQNSRERKCPPADLGAQRCPSSSPVCVGEARLHQLLDMSPQPHGVTSCTEAGWEHLSSVTGIRWDEESFVTEKLTGVCRINDGFRFQTFNHPLCQENINHPSSQHACRIPSVDALGEIQWSVWSVLPSWWVEFLRGFKLCVICYSKCGS